MEEPESAILSQYQAQGVTVALNMLERILFSVEELYTGKAESREGILVSLVNPLSPEERARLADLVGQARATIGTLTGKFGFHHETADLARETHGRLIQMWATLEDTRSHKLRRYGDVDPALPAALDPEIETLIRLVLAMDRVLFHHGPRHPEPQTHAKQEESSYERNP